MVMEEIMEYIQPELIIVSVVLYFIGIMLKNTEKVAKKYILLILGIVGVVLSILWVFASNDINGYQSVLLAIFTGIVQGILVAGLSNYVNQIIKHFIQEK